METDRYGKSGNDSFIKVIADPKSFIFVAEDRGELVGFITFRARYVVRYPQPIGQIEELFVLKKFRKQGVGKLLMRKAETAAKRMKCRRMYVESRRNLNPAHKFYQALGYKKSGYYFLKIETK